VCGDTIRRVKPEGKTDMETKKPVRRSQAWFGKNDRDGFVHRSWIKNQGYPHDLLDGRPSSDLQHVERAHALQRATSASSRSSSSAASTRPAASRSSSP
jgi:hypothetical protein